MTKEHKRLLNLYGKWYDIAVPGVGTSCIRALTPYDAIAEYCERMDLEVDKLQNYEVKELEA